MNKTSGLMRRATAPIAVRPVAASGAPDWMVASIERAVWCLLAIVAAIMVYLVLT
jgi:hypothetical protein